MLGMLQNINVAIGVAEIAAQAVGAPVATGLATEIVNSCQDVARYKRRAKSLGDKSTLLAISLTEDTQGLEGTVMQERMDEVVAVLERTLKRTRRWSSYSALTRWLRRAEIEQGINQCEQELDTAIQTFTLRYVSVDDRAQMDAHAMELQNHYENQNLLLQILASSEQMRRVTALHQAGESIGEEIMQEGQERLREMRQLQSTSGNMLVTEIRTSSPGPMSPTTTPSPSASQRVSQQYLEMQRGLVNLHRMAAILPPVKILDGEIVKVDDIPVAGGTYSDIWLGCWLDEEKVALKGLRNVKADDQSAQKRFVREIQVWSKLKNEHILSFYGIVTDQGRHMHMVSPWLENGNVLDYVKQNPEADKMLLIRGAAEGLRYLHSQNIVHGNIKCTNILVSASGDACISDFGMAKVIEDVTEMLASATLTESGSARWLAPEVIDGASPTKEADTYSFAMAILELLTGQHPFPERKRDAAVIRAVIDCVQPRRPSDPNVQRWLTDELWSVMQQCWSRVILSRPTMEFVAVELQKMQTT
ncbi:TKL/TKL-ccin protein kinase [Macrolepiota fuliginosa MF-IS2]|uniref:TKL/TKL-ccin protein kinase n=1 Tax=Macrolepiota fuliginosa MF-IS2 TaxID=1400762 RepID=A0A9P5XL16_9AGAR|nr:TKL/TKL-ccin protein kinase [Macrolepiota fuliginosa MF-IS2]